MMHRFLRLSRHTLLVVGLAGCASLPGMTPPTMDSAARWTVVVALVDQHVTAGRYAEADRLLVEFQRTNAGRPEAPEAVFYRALYRLDPANPGASPQEAIALLDAFLAMRIVSPHRTDADALRRIAMALAAKPEVVTVTAPRDATAASPSPQPRADSAEKDAEIAKLRDELVKANAELERIRRRVATPKP